MKKQIGSKLLACLLVFVLLFTSAPFGAFATEMDTDTVPETELVTEGNSDNSESGAADSSDTQSVPQGANDDPADISAPSDTNTEAPDFADGTAEAEDDADIPEQTGNVGAPSDVINGVSNEPDAIQPTSEVTDPDEPSAADTDENENSGKSNGNDAGDDTAGASETNDNSADVNGDAEINEGSSGNDADSVETEEIAEPDEIDDSIDETADNEAEADASFTASIKVVVNDGQTVYMGETVTLKVEVDDANYDYSIRWETHDPAGDIEGEEPVWNTVSRGGEYSFTATQAAVSLEYRAVAYAEQGEIVSRVVRISALERIEEQLTETEPEVDSDDDSSEGDESEDEPSVGEPSDEIVTDQENTSTDGNAGVESDDEDGSSDITDHAEENETDENDTGDDGVANTDSEDLPVVPDGDAENEEPVEVGSGSDADIPGDDNATGEENTEDGEDDMVDDLDEPEDAENDDDELNEGNETIEAGESIDEREEETDNADESEVIDGNEANEKTDFVDDADGEENTEDVETTESEDEDGTSEENENVEDENKDDGEHAQENDITDIVLFSDPIAIIHTYRPGISGPGNDELLTGYVEKLFGAIGSKRKLRSAFSVGSSLEDNNAIIYNGLKNMAAAVACGNETSTEYQYDFGEFGPWTAADLGLQTMVQYNAEDNTYSITQEAVNAAFSKAIEQLQIDVDEVMQALLADCPYELYWFDKTKTGGYSYGYSSPGLPYYCQNEEWYISCPIGFVCQMSVAAEYQAGEYIVDATKARGAHAAVAKVLDILNGASGMTTRQKLTYFKDQICDLVSYNHNAAGNNGVLYGNPWQLVWVFDGDPDTNVVCEGYSKAFKYLCDQVGISCLLVTGELGEGTGAGPHMWNIVILDGQSYVVDVTNSDTGSAGDDGSLFMATADSGSDWNVYTVSGVHYKYDDDTMATYSQEVLTVLDTGTSVEVPQPEFNGHSIILTKQIGLQFFLELPEGKTSSDYPGSYVTFAGNKINSETQHALPSSPAVINGQEVGTYLFEVDLSSIQMADKITPTFHYSEDGEEKTVVGDAYAVKDYIDWALGIGSSYLNNQQSRIIPKLADYGHYAQIYLSRQNNWTIGTSYAEMTTCLTSSYDYSAVRSATQGCAFSRTESSTQVSDVNYRLSLGSTTTLTVRILPATADGVLSITAGGASISQSGGYYMVTYPGVYANQLADTRTIQAGNDCSITVSPMSYVYEMLGNNTAQDDLKNLLCALYYYAEACN